MLKKGYEFSFAWIFTVIVGAFIIFLAIYIAMRVVESNRLQQETEAGKQIGILLNPVETILEQAKFATITLQKETILFNGCNSQKGTFGSQEIATKIKSRVGEEWTKDGGFNSSFHNKYLFSNSEVRSKKEFYVLSKPFKFPFKIADIIVVWPDTEKYCFMFGSTPSIGSPEARIKKEIEDLGLDKKNIYFDSSSNPCPAASKKVCFDSITTSNCDIEVELRGSTNSIAVTPKSKPTVYVAKSFDSTDPYPLLYAAIFSSPEIYECQIKRLAMRAEQLSLLYERKADIGKCPPNTDTIDSALIPYRNALSQIKNSQNPSQDFSSVYDKAEQVKEANDALSCRIF